jgi:excisionase family DNA binding protein
MTIDQLSKLLRITRSTIQRRIKNGEIPTKRVDKRKWGGNLIEIDDKWYKDLING